MPSKLWGVPLLVAGIVIGGIVLTIGWTCPSGGTAFCSHAYIAGEWAIALAVGVVLIISSVVLLATGGGRAPP